MKIITLRVKILAIVLFKLTLIGSAFVIYSFSTTANYKQLRLEGIEQLVGYETEKVNKIISEIERGAVFYALGGKITFQAGLESLGETLAVEYLKSFPTAVGGGFWFEPYAFKNSKYRAGFYAFYDRELKRVRLDDTFFIDRYDYHNTSWYKEIIQGITEPYQVVWTKPYVDDSGSYSLMVTAGSGVYDENDKLIAISTVDWELDEIVKQLIDIIPTKNSFVLFCEPKKDYVISCTHKDIVTGSSVHDIPWDIYAGNIKLDNINYMAFGKFLDNGALINIYIPENEIFAEVERRNSFYSLTIIVSSLIMVFVAYTLIAAFINRPIKKLTKDVANIALGNLDMQINIKTRDELGQLANTFNKMTSDLKKSIEENTKEREEKNRINAELTVASNIQLSMLPNIFPAFPGIKEFDLYAMMIPAKNVGGDFYDFYLIDKDNLAVVIADVSGKGIPAALFMVISKTIIKNLSYNKVPSIIFDKANEKLCENNDEGMFVTAFMGVYNIPTGRFSYVNAGHTPPFIKRKNSNFEFLKIEPSYVLGFMDDTKYKLEETVLEKGDLLYLYTDGITEAMNNEKELFSEERLISALAKNLSAEPKELIYYIKKEVDFFSEGAEPTDDLTMLALKINDFTEEKLTGNNSEIGEIQPAELVLNANLDELPKIFDFINPRLLKHEFSSLFINEIGIAAEEIFANITKYAYPNGSGTVKIRLITGENAEIVFEDQGIPYNPLNSIAPDLVTPPETREIGGLGIHLVKNLTNSISYSRKDDKNILVLLKSKHK